MNDVLRVKSDTVNRHFGFDEGKVASEKPRGWFLRCNIRKCLFVALSVASLCLVGNAETAQSSRTAILRERLKSGDTNYVFVALHQGDHSRGPGNSRASIVGAIEMGADIVEVDVRQAPNGRFYLSHDAIKEANPTNLLSFEEMMCLTRGKILVNVDKFFDAPVAILGELRRLDCLDQVLIKSDHAPDEVRKIFRDDWKSVESGEILYMPVIQFCWGRHRKAEKLLPAWQALEPRMASMYEICVDRSEFEGRIAEILAAKGRPRVWINTMWDDLAAGHGEAPPPSLAKGKPKRPIDAEACWGWAVAQGATMIQTDNGRALIEYLRAKGRH